MGRLDGKVVLITGGAGGMGSAQARLLAQEGAGVVIADVRDELGQQLVADIGKAGGTATCVTLDVTSEQAWQETIHDVESRHGHLDILINNAGINVRKPIATIEFDEWNRVLAVNLTGPLLGMKHAAPA